VYKNGYDFEGGFEVVAKTVVKNLAVVQPVPAVVVEVVGFVVV
jgi:hypothetical protein